MLGTPHLVQFGSPGGVVLEVVVVVVSLDGALDEDSLCVMALATNPVDVTKSVVTVS